MSALDDAWQAALAAEHQAVFGYGVLGPRLGVGEKVLARQFADAHAASRDRTTVALNAAGQQPVVAQADYPSLYPVPDVAAARLLAVRLEDACCLAWRVLYLRSAAGAGSAAVRAAAQTQLTASAVRATRWRALVAPAKATVPFPGL